MICARAMGVAVVAAVASTLGCTSVFTGDEVPTGLSAEVAAKAAEVADLVGGVDGFGGPLMGGYYGHMAAHMGFHGPAYLADPDADVVYTLVNESDWPCTFHLAYLRSSDGVDPASEEIVVQPGEELDFVMPCAEILGVGSLDEVGAEAAVLEDGTAFDNRMCVPGFLNSDYLCGSAFTCTLGPDVYDLDQDGDTEELIVRTDAMRSHMGLGGMMPHGQNGRLGGMMGNANGPMMGRFHR